MKELFEHPKIVFLKDKTFDYVKLMIRKDFILNKIICDHAEAIKDTKDVLELIDNNIIQDESIKFSTKNVLLNLSNQLYLIIQNDLNYNLDSEQISYYLPQENKNTINYFKKSKYPPCYSYIYNNISSSLEICEITNNVIKKYILEKSLNDINNNIHFKNIDCYKILNDKIGIANNNFTIDKETIFKIFGFDYVYINSSLYVKSHSGEYIKTSEELFNEQAIMYLNNYDVINEYALFTLFCKEIDLTNLFPNNQEIQDILLNNVMYNDLEKDVLNFKSKFLDDIKNIAFKNYEIESNISQKK